MTYQELQEKTKGQMGPFCKACPVCNGKACSNVVPGPGAKGTGDTAIRNFEAWKRIRINMDTIAPNRTPDTAFELFGRKLKYPIIAGPVGAVNLHYGDKYNDVQYNDILVPGCAKAGIVAMTGDGTNPDVMKAAVRSIAAADGMGIPTVKPWDINTLDEKFELIRSSGCFAVAMDIDAAGLPFLQGLTPPAGSKTPEELAEVIQKAGKPFIVKGIMTVEGAMKAKQAGARAIVVSNHGGRVQDQCPATAEVLYEIARAVKGSMTVLVDGGIRCGTDIFKALALGADAVVVARPYVNAVYGGGAEGIAALTEYLGQELAGTMKMCGVGSLREISERNLYRPSNPYLTM